MNVTTMRCPGCAVAMLPAGAPGCPQCGLSLTGPAAAELWQVEQALLANDQQRRGLLARRDTLLAFLRSPAGHQPAPEVRVPTTPQQQSSPDWTPGPPAPRVRPEASAQSVQNLLLALGGLLLAVAAVVFTVVAWGRFGIGGRASILLTFTGIALATPAVLVRRKLTSTAETIAIVGFVLMALDGYAAYHVGAFGLRDINGFGFTAVLLAVIAATATGYPRVVPLRLATPMAIVVAQPIVPLIAAAQHARVLGFTLAFAVVAGLDVALVAAIRRWSPLTPERVIAILCATVAQAFAAPVAVALTFFGDSRLPAAGVLALTGAVITFAAVLARSLPLRVILAGLGSLLVAAAAVGAALPHLGAAGAIAPAVAAVLLGLAAIRAPKDWRLGGLGASSVLLGAGGLAVLAPVGAAVLGPFTWLFDPWSGAGDAARATITDSDFVWSGSPWVLPVVVLLGAGAAIVGSGIAGRRGIAAAAAGCTVLATAVAPVALDLTRPTGLIVQGAIAAALCLSGALLKRPLLCWAAGAAGLTLATIALAGCAAASTSTLVGLGVAIAVFAVSAVAARYAQVGAVAAGLLVLAATAEAAAAVLAAGNGPAAAGWAMLGVAALAAGCVHLAEHRLRHHARALAAAMTISCFAAVINAAEWLHHPGLLFAVAGGIVVIGALRRPRGSERQGFLALAILPVVGALGSVARPVFEAYVLPYAWIGTGWGNAPHDARDAVAPSFAWSGDALVPAVLGVAALAISMGVAALWGRAMAVRLAVPVVALTGGLVPLAFDLSWPVQLITLGALACALLAAAALDRMPSLLPPSITGPSAAVLAATTIALSLATAAATVLALAVTGAAALLAAVCTRATSVRLAAAVVSASAAVLTVVAAVMAAGEPARFAAFAAIVTAAGLAGVAALLHRERCSEALCCEAVAIGGALLGIALSAARPLTLSIALAGTGLAVGATALRTDRRMAGYFGTALVIVGSWVRFAELGITAPEAYTVPVGVAGLVIGWLRWRQRRRLSSWLVVAPGLASALLPSLAALYVSTDDTSVADHLRPLVLGAAALVVVLVGAWRRLQAPLIIGGGVLAGVALHELAPWVAAAVGALPPWVPLTAAGLLLLALGATYEQRRRDLAKVRDALLRMT